MGSRVRGVAIGRARGGAIGRAWGRAVAIVRGGRGIVGGRSVAIARMMSCRVMGIWVRSWIVSCWVRGVHRNRGWGIGMLLRLRRGRALRKGKGQQKKEGSGASC